MTGDIFHIVVSNRDEMVIVIVFIVYSSLDHSW